MDSSLEIQTRLSAYLTNHFVLSGGDWSQAPHIDALFVIYRGAIDYGWNEDDLRHHIRVEWPRQHVKQLSNEAQEEVGKLCGLLTAWTTYERCQTAYVRNRFQLT